jgi:uncharacterized protein YutE (UPF0331/DUF86 family)
MTPAVPSWETVAAKLRLISESLDDLDSLGDITDLRLRDDRVIRAAVERLLTRIVDLAVDINSHVAVSQLGQAPSTYREAFALAAKAGLIAPRLADELQGSAGLRNVIVHMYAEMDLGALAAAVPRARSDYRRYVTEVAAAAQRLRDAAG